jgi:hypothetical protein
MFRDRNQACERAAFDAATTGAVELNGCHKVARAEQVAWTGGKAVYSSACDATARLSSWHHARSFIQQRWACAQHAATLSPPSDWQWCRHPFGTARLPDNSSGVLCTPGTACLRRPLGHLHGHGASRTTSALMWWPNRTISISLIMESAPRRAAAMLLALYDLASLSGGTYSYISPDLHLSPPCCGHTTRRPNPLLRWPC